VSLYISNSDANGGWLVARVLVLVIAMLIFYWYIVATFNLNAVLAETNANSGLIRLQRLRDADAPVSAIAGSSMIARLNENVIFDAMNSKPINMGIDGGNSLYATHKIVDSGNIVKILVIEANTIMQKPSENMNSLEYAEGALDYKLSKYVPLLKRKYRPVSLLYNALKLYKDNRNPEVVINRGAMDAIQMEFFTFQIEFDNDELEILNQWVDLIKKLQAGKTQLLLVMLPDGSPERINEYRFGKKLAAKCNLPFLDLKQQLSDLPLVYSDGRHLTYQSANIVSYAIRSAIEGRGL